MSKEQKMTDSKEQSKQERNKDEQYIVDPISEEPNIRPDEFQQAQDMSMLNPMNDPIQLSGRTKMDLLADKHEEPSIGEQLPEVKKKTVISELMENPGLTLFGDSNNTDDNDNYLDTIEEEENKFLFDEPKEMTDTSGNVWKELYPLPAKPKSEQLKVNRPSIQFFRPSELPSSSSSEDDSSSDDSSFSEEVSSGSSIEEEILITDETSVVSSLKTEPSKRLNYLKTTKTKLSRSDKEKIKEIKNTLMKEASLYFPSTSEVKSDFYKVVEREANRVARGEFGTLPSVSAIKENLTNAMIEGIKIESSLLISRISDTIPQAFLDETSHMLEDLIKGMITNYRLGKKKEASELKYRLSKFIVDSASNLERLYDLVERNQVPTYMRDILMKMVQTKMRERVNIKNVVVVTDDDKKPNITHDDDDITIVIDNKDPNNKIPNRIIKSNHRLVKLEKLQPSWISEIKKKSNLLILDIDNMKRAMHLTDDQIIAFVEYVALYGISCIQCVYDLNTRLKNVDISLSMESNEHDDIMMLMTGYMNDAVIVTNDNHKEFVSSFLICTKHNCMVMRRNDNCRMYGIGVCNMRTLKVSEIGRMSIYNIMLSDKKMVKLELANPIIRYRGHPMRFVKSKHQCPIPSIQHQVVSTSLITNSFNENIGCVNITRLIGTDNPITSLHLSLKTGLHSIITGNVEAGIADKIEEMTQLEIESLQEALYYTMKVSNKELVLVNDKENKVIGRNYNIPFILTDNIKKVTTIAIKSNLNKHYKVTQKLQDIQEEISSSEYAINLSDYKIHFTTKMTDNKILLITNGQDFYLVKCDQFVIDAIDKMVYDSITEGESYSTNKINCSGMSTVSKQSLNALFLSADSTKEGVYYDVASRVIPDNSRLIKLNSKMNPSKPSYSIMENPSECNWTLAMVGLPITKFSERASRIKVNEKAITDNYNIIQNSMATHLFTEWGNYVGEESYTINVNTVVWNDRTIQGTNVTKNEVKVISSVIPDIIQWKINKVTKDIIDAFRDIAQGFKGIALPSLILGIKLPMIEMKVENSQHKAVFPLMVTCYLPTCYVLSKIMLTHDPSMNYMVSLISVSPPITHNYIAMKLGLDVTIENEYNTLMCEKVENESYDLFDLLMDKIEHINAYMTYYGVFAEGLRMLGLDPMETIINQVSVIEHGITIKKNVELLGLHIIKPTTVFIDNYLLAMVSNQTNGVILKRFITNNKINISKEIHMMINMLIRTKLIDDAEKTNFVLTHAQYIVGRTNIMHHLRYCYNLNVNSKTTILKAIIALRKAKQVDKCTTEKKIDIPLLTDENYIKTRSMEMESQENVTMYATVEGVTGNILATNTVKTTNIRKSVPVAGRVTIVKIESELHYERMTRTVEIEQFLYDRPNLDIKVVSIKDKLTEDTIKQLEDAIQKSSDENRSVILVTYDKWPSMLKKTTWFTDNNYIKMKDDKILYIPDILTYNVLNRKIMLVETGNMIKTTIDTIEEYEELKDTMKDINETNTGLWLGLFILTIIALIMRISLISGLVALSLTVIFFAKYKVNAVVNFIDKKMLPFFNKVITANRNRKND